MKVLITGEPNSNADNLARMFEYYGVETYLVPLRMSRFIKRWMLKIRPDISLVFNVGHFTWIIRTQRLGGKKIFRAMGTDVHKMDFVTRQVLRFLHKHNRARICYASHALRDKLGLDGEVLPTPIDTTRFYPMGLEREKDVLYYCRKKSCDIYRMDRLEAYMREHPNETVTIAEGSIDHLHMNRVYNQHKKYMRWTTHDANPKMIYEALLAGCEVWFNDTQITEIPDVMLMPVNIPKWIDYFERVLDE